MRTKDRISGSSIGGRIGRDDSLPIRFAGFADEISCLFAVTVGPGFVAVVAQAENCAVVKAGWFFAKGI